MSCDVAFFYTLKLFEIDLRRFSMALWGGRFEAGVAQVTQEFGASLPVDKHLYR